MPYNNIKYIMIKIMTLKKIFYKMALSLKVFFKENENNKSFRHMLVFLLHQSLNANVNMFSKGIC